MNSTPTVHQVKPVVVVLFDSAASRIPHPFGKGLLRSTPTYQVDYSASDASWWAAESTALATARELAEFNALVEEMANETEARRAMEAGLSFA